MPSPLSNFMRRLSAQAPLSSSRQADADGALTTQRGTAADALDVVWLLDNTAAGDAAAPQRWRLRFVAAYFAAHTGAELAGAVAEVSAALGLAAGAAERRVVEERVRPFFLAVLAERAVGVRWATGEAMRLGPGDAGGVSRNEVVLEGPRRDGEAVGVEADAGVAALRALTTFAGPEGWAVVSDIDDTIKLTMTNSRTGILRTTFVDDPVPIAGQPEFYAHMARVLGGPPFWYLSASPYNLYPFLREFRNKYYPPGTMLLRNTSWQDVAKFIGSMANDTLKYKVEHLENIWKEFPQRKLVCLGDSTQSDPEAYGESYRRHPQWIKKIFIRKVHVAEMTDILPGQGNEERNSPARFEKAFKGVPQDVWYVFTDPKELFAQVDELVK